MDGRRRAIGYALMAAVFCALNAPLPKLMPGDVPPGRNVPDKRIINYSTRAHAGNARRFACGRA